MKRLTISDIYQKALEDFEVDLRKTPRTFEESAKKKIRKVAQNNPHPGSKSYFGTAKSPGTQTGAREFTPHVADIILTLCRSYFSRFSKNERIRSGETFESIVRQAEDSKNRVKNTPSYEELKAQQQFSEEAAFEAEADKYRANMYMAFQLEYGREPVDDEEAFCSGLEPVNFDWDPDFPGPASQKELDLFYADDHYTLRYDNDLDPHMITGVVTRPYDDAKKRAESKKYELMLNAIYDLFFEPIDEQVLIEDIYRDIDPHVEHHDEAFFSNREKLKNVQNYCHLRANPAAGFGLNQKILDNFLRDLRKMIF